MESPAPVVAAVAGEGGVAGGRLASVAVRRTVGLSTLFVALAAGEGVAAAGGEESAGAVKLPGLLPVAVGRGALALVANAAGVFVGEGKAETAAEGGSSSDITPAVNEAIAITTKSVLNINRRFLRLWVWCRYILPLCV